MAFRASFLFPLSLALAVVFGAALARASGPFRGQSSVGARRVLAAKDLYLQAHNDARSKLHIPRLKWSTKLAKVATKWARNIAQTCVMKHTENNPYGENLYMEYGYPLQGLETRAVAAWVGEKKSYKRGRFPAVCSGECGHYTQVIWKDTREVGCGYATCSDGATILLACEYNPPGNYMGEFPY